MVNTLLVTQDGASSFFSQHYKNHFRMMREASTVLINWLCRGLFFWRERVTFLEAHTQNTRQRKSYHYPHEPVVWKDEQLASGSCKEWWGVRYGQAVTHSICFVTTLSPSPPFFNAVTLLYRSARKMNYIGVPSLSYQTLLFQPTK